MSVRLGLCGLVIALIAACGLYLMKDRVNQLDGELRRHQAMVVAEQGRLHRLRAEWAMLNQPSRIARLAAEHLDLRPAPPIQIVGIEDLPRRADLALDEWRRRALLPSGAEVDLRLKPRRPLSSFDTLADTLAKALRREP
jgi:cell division protein FtsL